MENDAVLNEAIEKIANSMNNHRLAATLSIGFATAASMFFLLVFANKPNDADAFWLITLISVGTALMVEVATVTIFSYSKLHDEKQLLEIKQLLRDR